MITEFWQVNQRNAKVSHPIACSREQCSFVENVSPRQRLGYRFYKIIHLHQASILAQWKRHRTSDSDDIRLE